MPKQHRKPNFLKNTLVIWRTSDHSSYIERQEEVYGKGPFLVYDARYGDHDIPQIKLRRRSDGTVVHSAAGDGGADNKNKDWFRKELFEEILE